MTFDELQSHWQSHDPGNQMNIDTDVLLKEIQRNHQSLARSLFQRDAIEIGASFVVTCGCVYLANFLNEWTLYVLAAGSFFVGMFFVVDRWRQYRRHPAAEKSVRWYLETSLSLVLHQIWLLENVFWWYLLPLVPGLILFLASSFFQARTEGPIQAAIVLVVALICGLALWVAYRINKRAIKKTLEPRREELQSFLANLD